MNPNSRNQRWSKWTFSVRPGGARRPTFSDIKSNAARFARKAFGSATQMRITQTRFTIIIEVRTEGHPAHEVPFVDYMAASWRRWAVEGWGPGTTLTCTATLEAGTRQDGTPPDQLIIAPPIPLFGGQS